MKYSYNWLKEISGVKIPAEKAANLLTMHSFELEGLEKGGVDFKKVVVGEILEIEKHPNADKLQITKVTVGIGRDLSIVCGAHNIKVGDKVPVALVGAILPNGIEIKEAEIRGEKSFGMLCAKDELGLGDDHSGIIILDSKAKVGEKVGPYLSDSDDTIFDIKVLPDRAHDAMSHVGVARELAVLNKKKFEYDFDGLKLPKTKKAGESCGLSIEIKDKKLCPRYMGAVINIKIKPSPQWMQERLKTCGINPINNVVDTTNYIMLELGQPLHAFDAKEIAEENELKIIVRKAKQNEEMVLLDDTKIKLTEEDLLITNGETPLALAGIMGGLKSGVNEKTKTIVLEAANFNSTNIRRSRTRLGIQTESSDRFEREIDPNLAEKAMVRAIEILEHIAEGKLEKIADVYPNKTKPQKIKLEFDYINNLLGEDVPKKEALAILNSLEIKTKIKKDFVLAEAPTFRVDLKTPEDLIEEIGRIWGYDKIEARPLIEPVIPAKKVKQLDFERRLKSIIASLGFDEMYNYSFYSEQETKKCGLEMNKHFELANPMNPNQQLVRISLVPNILKNVKLNSRNFEEINIFEIGKAYYKEKNVKERRILGIAKVLEKDKQSDSFYSLKGTVEDLLGSLGIESGDFYKETRSLPNNHWLHPTRSAEIEINGVKVGYLGEINPIVLKKYKIEKKVAFCDIDTEKLLEILPKEKTFIPIQKFPTIIRDVSLMAKTETKAADIQNLIKEIGGNLVMKVEMFDVFFKEGKTSLAYHIEFGSPERTLESDEVDATMEKILSGLEKELGVEIRK